MVLDVNTQACAVAIARFDPTPIVQETPENEKQNAGTDRNIGNVNMFDFQDEARFEISDIYENGFNSPAQEWLPDGLNTIVSAQAIFPLLAQFEMAGNPKENEIAGAVPSRPGSMQLGRFWPNACA